MGELKIVNFLKRSHFAEKAIFLILKYYFSQITFFSHFREPLKYIMRIQKKNTWVPDLVMLVRIIIICLYVFIFLSIQYQKHIQNMKVNTLLQCFFFLPIGTCVLFRQNNIFVLKKLDSTVSPNICDMALAIDMMVNS